MHTAYSSLRVLFVINDFTLQELLMLNFLKKKTNTYPQVCQIFQSSKITQFNIQRINNNPTIDTYDYDYCPKKAHQYVISKYHIIYYRKE